MARKPLTNEQWAVLAAEDGNIDFLRLAIERGADLGKLVEHPIRSASNTYSANSRRATTPLIEAVAGGHEAAVEALLDAGADPGFGSAGLSPASIATGRIAKMLMARAPDPEAAERDAFAAGMDERSAKLSGRDITDEARAWIDKGVDPFAPIFAGRSLLSLLAEHADKARTPPWGYRSRVSLSEKMHRIFEEIIGRAATRDEMDVAVGTALKLEMAEAADAAIERGALDGMAKERLDGLLKQACLGFRSEFANARERLLAAGADPRIFVLAAYRNGRFDEVGRMARENPGIVSGATDDDGRGLAWMALSDLAEHRLNDPHGFADAHAQAKALLEVEGARVLTGTGLGRQGPPACAFAADLAARSEIKNAKRAEKAGALAEKILAMARAEALEFGDDCENPNAPLPKGFNILHLAFVCGDGEVTATLMGKAAALGPGRVMSMAKEWVGARTLDEWKGLDASARERREPARPQTAFGLLLSKEPSTETIGLALEFARIAGVNSELSPWESVFTAICLWMDPKKLYAAERPRQFLEPLRRLFDLGADPQALVGNPRRPLLGRPLLEVLKERHDTRAERVYGSTDREEFEERWRMVEAAFLDAAGKGMTKDPAPKKRETI